ncbi:MAG TPA: sigma-54-dependent Fis family transcriptional regulator [Myxococcales bacterium]|nr:sigma-54-dependent Fis family transcriptional regulator [Myxococcales bacterium]HIN86349.1 sigma-54-dependent Fis family transcriptional regulator [Myxococcales bacterium]
MPIHAPNSPLVDVLTLIKRVAPTDCNVLVTGESGTGKEIIVRALHYWSNRKRGPIVPVNCGAIPENLLESELFGHVRGAFTGADRPRQGRFELANRGTIFLDEIGELPLALQVKLLRVIQERAVQPLGAPQPKKVDFRLVAATNVSLEDAVRAQGFREDLYYRLNVMRVQLPALRERPMDIRPLVQHFISLYNERLLTEVTGFDAAGMALLETQSWPGNVRELENFVQGLMVLAGDGVISQAAVAERLDERARFGMTERPQSLLQLSPPSLDFPEEGVDLVQRLDMYESRLIDEALRRSEGNKSKAARLLGLNRTTLVEKLKRKGTA